MTKKIITIIFSLVFILSTLAGCRKMNNDMSSGNFLSNSSEVYSIVDVVEDDNSSDIILNESDISSSDNQQTSVTGNNASSSNKNNYSSQSGSNNTSNQNGSTENTDKSNSNSSNSFTENVVSVGNGGQSGDTSSTRPSTFVESEDESTGSNDSKKTYSTALDEAGNVITVDIEAGKSVYYKIMAAGNKWLTINSANAYVIYNNVTYRAQNGVVNFFVESDLTDSDRVLFEIGNCGTATESFTINFSSPKGSHANPEVVNSIENDFTIKLDEGNDQGYFYKYSATKNGKMRFYILSDVESGKLTVEKIIDKELQVIQQRSTTETEDYVKSDSIGTYVELEVKKGDEIFIKVEAISEVVGEYPETTIKWKALYE